MNYECVQCHQELAIPPEGEGRIFCPQCGFEYFYAKNYLEYNSDSLLFNRFKKKYLLYKVLNNNGYFSYHFLKETSLSLPERPEVTNFRNYIRFQIPKGRILDVGCGILPTPGYLDFKEKQGFEFYGIDPIKDRSFNGVRVVGCAEFMPFQEKSFDAIIFATSLDHVCSKETAIQESYRVLNNKGKIIIWMSDLKTSFINSMKDRVGIILESIRKGYRIDRFILYPNFTVLYVPKGAIDPFHFYVESPKEVIRQMERAKFKMFDATYCGRLEVFLSFIK